jgi:hypothetical protein
MRDADGEGPVARGSWNVGAEAKVLIEGDGGSSHTDRSSFGGDASDMHGAPGGLTVDRLLDLRRRRGVVERDS